MLIREDGLGDFRRDYLAPEVLLALVERHVRCLVRLPVGVGKSHAVDGLLESPRLFEEFAFVVYAAPTWRILRERRIVRGDAKIAVPWMLMRPRPKDWCADYDDLWGHYERRSCSTYAKATLCRECQRLGRTVSPCAWPTQFSRVKDQRLLFLTEQQLMLNRALIPMLRSLIDGGRILVVLDEARMLDSDFEVAIADEHLADFSRVLAAIPTDATYSQWIGTIDAIRERRGLHDRLDLPPWLHRDAFVIQQAGVGMFGDAFRYIGYDLSLLASSHSSERWSCADGIKFIGRPFLNCHVLLLSAHLSGDYAGERLGCGPLASPFETIRFQHSRTRILNLRNRAGADRYFFRNHRQILDTIAVLIARNVQVGITTLLISRKKSKELSARYLSQRLAGWGIDVRFLCEDYGTLPEQPQPQIVPVIHYGILGVNDFTDYQAAYCINGYYISSRELTRAAQESIPKGLRATLSIDSQPDKVRRAKVSKGADPGGVLAHTASIYLRKLELDPVVQAAGRVRFATKPREVIFFQMADLEPLVGPHEVVGSLAQLRRSLGIRAAREVDDRLETTALDRAIQAGATAKQAADELGISLSTARRRLRTVQGGQGVKSPLYNIREEIWHPARPAQSGGPA
ncbi:MAG: hypothetical protein ABIP94_11175 [Planctomycetota bacterium]